MVTIRLASSQLRLLSVIDIQTEIREPVVPLGHILALFDSAPISRFLGTLKPLVSAVSVIGSVFWTQRHSLSLGVFSGI